MKQMTTVQRRFPIKGKSLGSLRTEKVTSIKIRYDADGCPFCLHVSPKNSDEINTRIFITKGIGRILISMLPTHFNERHYSIPKDFINPFIETLKTAGSITKILDPRFLTEDEYGPDCEIKTNESATDQKNIHYIFMMYLPKECWKADNGDVFIYLENAEFVDNMNDFDFYDASDNDIGNSPGYEKYGGAYGLDDDTIDSAFEGDPENYWNID